MLNTFSWVPENGMPFEISLTKSIKADREFVFDWWTDLSPDDSGLVKPLESRSVVLRTPKLIVLRDEEKMYFRRMVFNVRVTLERPARWTAEYEGKAARARSEYNLRQEEDGTTTLSYHTSVQPLGFLTRAFSPLVKPFIKRVFAREMKTFVRVLEDDYSKLKGVGRKSQT